MSSVQGFICFLNVFAPDLQFGTADSWIHSTGIIGPEHGLNSHLIQDSFRDLGIRG
jgi:hypothetical protein